MIGYNVGTHNYYANVNRFNLTIFEYILLFCTNVFYLYFLYARNKK